MQFLGEIKCRIFQDYGSTNMPLFFHVLFCHVLQLSLHYLVCEAMRRGSSVFFADKEHLYVFLMM